MTADLHRYHIARICRKETGLLKNHFLERYALAFYIATPLGFGISGSPATLTLFRKLEAIHLILL